MTPEPLERMDRIERVEKWLIALAPLGPVRLHYQAPGQSLVLAFGTEAAADPPCSAAPRLADPAAEPAGAAGPARVTGLTPPAEAAGGEPVKAPAFGVFQAAHPLRPEMALAPGSRVAQGQTLAYLAVGPVLQALRAPRDGVLLAWTVESGARVDRGDVLYRLS